MSELNEEVLTKEILIKAKEFQYQTAIVECALFKQNRDEKKWHIYVLKITLTRTPLQKEKIKIFIKKNSFVIFQTFWSIQKLKGFLSAFVYVRKAYNENNQTYPKEGIVFNIDGYLTEICGNYPRNELQFIGSDSAQKYYHLREDRPFYMIEYALYTQNGGILNTRSPTLENENPPFSNPAQAVNHFFNISLDTNCSDFRNRWVGLILPVQDAKISSYRVKGKNLKIEIERDNTASGKEKLDLNVICQDKDQKPFSIKLPAKKTVSIDLSFLPQIVDINLFKEDLKLDHCRWIYRNQSIFGSSKTKNKLFSNESIEDLNLLFDSLKLHPKIIRVSKKAFESSLYAEAILNAYKEVILTVRKISELNHLDGKPLMEHAFSIDKPKIKLNKLITPSERDEQIGFMLIFSGVALGIRNPKAHENIEQRDPHKTLGYLSLASLLMRKIDERIK
jgi:uncharacterized protein (TIGR02391 family)